MSIHSKPHDDAGRVVTISRGRFAGKQYRIEDWWDRLYGSSWMVSDGNPAAMSYGIRSGLYGLPLDDEVVYGKIDGLGHLVHVTEI